MGSAESLFRGVVLAVASVGAAVLAPLALMAVGHSKGFGTRAAALLLAGAMFSYTSVSSLGFIATAKDVAVSGRAAVSEAHADRRWLIEATRAELAGIKGNSRDARDRREDLLATLASLTKADAVRPAAVKADAQASALAFYIRQAGYGVTDDAVSIWLSLAMVLTLELGAALSLSVAAALRPVRLEAPTAVALAPKALVPAEPEMPASEPVAQSKADDKDDLPPPPPPKPRGKGGRPVAITPEAAAAKLSKAGKANGVRHFATILGVGRGTAHRVMRECEALGLLRFDVTPAGCRVALPA
jgi:hypothetical protein